MDEKKAKELTDSIFNKLNNQERVYLAWIHNQKNKTINELQHNWDDLRKWLEDVYYGRGKYHMDSDVIGIKDVIKRMEEIAKGSNKE